MQKYDDTTKIMTDTSTGLDWPYSTWNDLKKEITEKKKKNIHDVRNFEFIPLFRLREFFCVVSNFFLAQPKFKIRPTKTKKECMPERLIYETTYLDVMLWQSSILKRLTLSSIDARLDFF